MSEQGNCVAATTFEAIWQSWNRVIVLHKSRSSTNNNNSSSLYDNHNDGLHKISTIVQHLRNAIIKDTNHLSWTSMFSSVNNDITPKQIMTSLIGATVDFVLLLDKQPQQYQYGNNIDGSLVSGPTNLACDILDMIIKMLHQWDVSFIYESFLATMNRDGVDAHDDQNEERSEEVLISLFRLLRKAAKDKNTKIQGCIIQIFDILREAAGFVVGHISIGSSSSNNNNNNTNYGYNLLSDDYLAQYYEFSCYDTRENKNNHFFSWGEIARIVIDYLLSFEDHHDCGLYDERASAVSLLVGLFKNMDIATRSLLFDQGESSLLKEDSTNMNQATHNDNDDNGLISRLCNHLLLQIQNLNRMSGSLSSSCRLGWMSFSLLSLIQQKGPYRAISELDTIVRTTNLIDNITRAALRVKDVNNNHSGPSEEYSNRSEPPWTLENQDIRITRAALHVLCTLKSISHGEGWEVFIERMETHYQNFCQAKWKFLLERYGAIEEIRGMHDDTTALESDLRALLLIHTSNLCRPAVNNALMEVLKNSGNDIYHQHDDVESSQPCQKLLMSLCALISHHNSTLSVTASALLNNFLTLQKNRRNDDELSRSIWNAIDLHSPILLNTLMKFARDLTTGRPEEGCKIRLACILNIIDGLLSTPRYSRKVLLENDLGKMNTWVELVKGIMIRGDYELSQLEKNNRDGQEVHIILTQDEDTPVMGNLESDKYDTGSKPQQYIMSSEHHTRNNLSMMVCRLLSATILARLAYVPYHNDRVNEKEHLVDQLTLLQADIRSSLHEFLVNIPCIIKQRPSQTIRQCLTRLYTLVALSSEESESLISFVMFAIDLNEYKKLDHNREQLEEYKKKLEEMEHKTNRLTQERNRYKNQLISQQLTHERDIQRVQQRASADSLRLVDVYAAERSRAIARSHELVQQTSRAEAKTEKAQITAQTAQETCERTKVELSDAMETIRKLEGMLKEKCELIRNFESKNAQMSQSIRTNQEELSAAKKRIISLQDSLSHSEESLSNAVVVKNQFQDNLENSYSDLVSLAYFYEDREKGISKLRKKNEATVNDFREKLEAQRHRKEELEDANLKLERESERLKRKLARTKENLEEERCKRRQEQERRKHHGPVSYLNQLHDDSMISIDKSGRERSMRERSIYSGKENDYSISHSSSSRRHINR